MVLLGGTPAAMVKAEAEVEVAEEIGEGGEAAVLEVATTVVEAPQWAEVAEEAPVVVALVDVAGATPVSGRRTSEQFTILGSRSRRTRSSPGSRLSPTTLPNSPFVRFSNLLPNALFYRFLVKVLDGGRSANPVWRELISLPSACPKTPSSITQSR